MVSWGKCSTAGFGCNALRSTKCRPAVKEGSGRTDENRLKRPQNLLIVGYIAYMEPSRLLHVPETASHEE